MKITNSSTGEMNADWLESQFFLGYGYHTNEIQRQVYKLVFWKIKEFNNIENGSKLFRMALEKILCYNGDDKLRTIFDEISDYFDISLSEDSWDIIDRHCFYLEQAIENSVNNSQDSLIMNCLYKKYKSLGTGTFLNSLGRFHQSICENL